MIDDIVIYRKSNVPDLGCKRDLKRTNDNAQKAKFSGNSFNYPALHITAVMMEHFQGHIVA